MEKDEYRLNTDVEIIVMAGSKCLYKAGEGKLTYDEKGFSLYKTDGTLIHNQPPLFTYSLNADYNWYELGDVICIGDRKKQFYCIPKDNVSVTKARFVAEERYKILKEQLKK